MALITAVYLERTKHLPQQKQAQLSCSKLYSPFVALISKDSPLHAVHKKCRPNFLIVGVELNSSEDAFSDTKQHE